MCANIFAGKKSEGGIDELRSKYVNNIHGKGQVVLHRGIPFCIPVSNV